MQPVSLLTAVLLPICSWVSCQALLIKPHVERVVHPYSLTVGRSSVQVRRATQWLASTTDVWAALVLRNSPDDVNASFDFTKADAETNKTFVEDCNETFSIEYAFALADEVVLDMCLKATGTSTECNDMTHRLWVAYNASNVYPWCIETYNWFAKKTEPRCLAKCKAIYCKNRCGLSEKYKDLQDELAAWLIKFKMYDERLNRTMADTGLTALASNISFFNSTKLVPLAANISNSSDAVVQLAEQLSNATQALPSIEQNKYLALNALLAAQAAVSSSQALANATQEFIAASQNISKLKRDFSSANASLLSTNKSLEELRETGDACQLRLTNISIELDAENTYVSNSSALLIDDKSELANMSASVGNFNQTTWAPAAANLSRLVKTCGNLGLKERLLEEALSEEKVKSLELNSTYGTMHETIRELNASAAEHYNASRRHFETWNQTSNAILNISAEIDALQNDTIDNLSTQIEALESNRTAAAAALKEAQSAVRKTELEAAKAASDYDTAQKRTTWDTSDAAKARVNETEELKGEADKAFQLAQALEFNRSRELDVVDDQLPPLRTSYNDALATLKDAKAELAKTLEAAQSAELMMNSSLDDYHSLLRRIGQVTNASIKIQQDLNESNALQTNLTGELSQINHSQVELATARDVSNNATQTLERMMSKLADEKRQVREFELQINRTRDQVELLEGKLNTTNGTCLSTAAKIKSTENISLVLASKLGNLSLTIQEANATKTSASAKVVEVEANLTRNVTICQAEYNRSSTEHAYALSNKSALNAELISAKGKQKKMEAIYAYRDKVFNEMRAEYSMKMRRSEPMIAEVNASRIATLKEIARVRTLMQPIEDKIQQVLNGTLQSSR